jgi:deoxyribodipyrimidine photo-lyase
MTKIEFPTRYPEILAMVAAIDPVRYAKSRNFIDGAVTRLSPYISRGVISTRQVMQHLLESGYASSDLEKLLQELAWRDFFQQVWRSRGEGINQDLRQPQPGYTHTEMPSAILQGSTGITGIDNGIKGLFETGYMHNHVRMYTAALACNIGLSHWKTPAQWMYYHLLDADWASNACSWQWVAGAFSGKKYYANQENINRYTATRDVGTYLDTDYAALSDMKLPQALQARVSPALSTPLPRQTSIQVDPALPTLLYNFYNLDPRWHAELNANRVLLLEPSVFGRYPVSAKSIAFLLALAENIPGIQVFVGELADLTQTYLLRDYHYKEHPLNSHYQGTEEPRDWMFPAVTGEFGSFFAFWKKAERSLKQTFLDR